MPLDKTQIGERGKVPAVVIAEAAAQFIGAIHGVVRADAVAAAAGLVAECAGVEGYKAGHRLVKREVGLDRGDTAQLKKLGHAIDPADLAEQ
jgi:hypothetical protein